MYKIMTPGPVTVRQNVRDARSLATTNPDMDPEFVEFYKETCDMLGGLMNSSGDTYILGGEGILALEAACASLTEKGDRVLVIDNGLFGKGFADFIEIYGGEPVFFTSDYRKPIDVSELEAFLEKSSDFKYATLVHCDTPTGVLNDISEICPLLKKYNIMTVVDSVSAMYGEPVDVDASGIDILCGGSQKALSAPPGLATLCVSEDAKKAMNNRKTPVASFYASIPAMMTYYEDKWFPYTMPVSDIMGIRVALENVKNDKDILARHAEIAEATRKAVEKSGLSLYLEEGFANTVTVIELPDGLTDEVLLRTLREKHNLLLGGGLGDFSGKVFRIGHMGENATVENMVETMKALDSTFAELGYPLDVSLEEEFKKNI